MHSSFFSIFNHNIFLVYFLLSYFLTNYSFSLNAQHRSTNYSFSLNAQHRLTNYSYSLNAQHRSKISWTTRFLYCPLNDSTEVDWSTLHR